MGKINLLSKSVSELIAAGEVVERPASVVKETVENSIDADAKHITVEIKNGGVTFIRVTDDGCGIQKEDVPTAFLRHATSKIKTENDLIKIETLGFRGEALAAISSVSKVELITLAREETVGTHYVICGGEEKENSETGCPTGTTLIVRDLFYNTPARMKFLKKDSSEGTAVSAIVERAALSHPEIAFKFIRDGKQIFSTPGDGQLKSVIYSVLGREFFSSLIPVNNTEGGISVSGFTCKPVFCRASRSHQFIFLNGRLVLSKTVMAAVEQAYKGSSMVGKFPGFVLSLTLPADTVDVNVSPSKTEVRFADERKIFSAVFYAVKSALSSGDTRPEITPQKKADNFFRLTAEEYRQTAVKLEKQGEKPTRLNEDNLPFFMRKDVKEFKEKQNIVSPVREQKTAETKPIVKDTVQIEAEQPHETEKEYSPKEEIKYVGEVFYTYIAVTRGEELFLIDKHAAHERILYNKFKSERKIYSQTLLTPFSVKLSAAEHTAITENSEALLNAGFEIEDFGQGTVLVRAIPSELDREDIEKTVTEVAESLTLGGNLQIDALDNIYHTVACKAAIKANGKQTKEELLNLALKVFGSDDVMYCPHGRPVAFKIKKSELEKYFGRIQ